MLPKNNFEKLKNRTGHRYRIFKHLDRIKQRWKNNQISQDFPASLEIHPSDLCNLNCDFCAFDDKKSGLILSSSVFEKLITEIIAKKTN